MNSKVEVLERRIERARIAQLEAESVLEEKALELHYANTELRHLNARLEEQVAERSSDLVLERTRLHTLITSLDSGVLLEDENRKVVLINQHFCDLFGLTITPEQAVGFDNSNSGEQTKHHFAHPEKQMLRAAELLERREICVGEEIQIADGRIFNRTFIPIFAGEKYLGHLWQYNDITVAHRAAESLRQSEEKYRGIIENMEMGLMEIELDGTIIRAYSRFCEMVGYSEAELAGKSAVDLVVPEFLPILAKQRLERGQGKAGMYEVQMFRKDGERVWVLISGAPIFGPDGQVTGAIGIHCNITKQKNLQEELETARYNAEAAQEAEKQFLANMSHEIRTPLNAIIGMSHLLFDTEPSPEQCEYLDILRNSSEILRALITDVLDFSKIRAGHLEVQSKEFDVTSLVRSMVKSTQLRHEDRPVRVVANIDSAIKNLILGDDLLLHQVLGNLIGNAEKFTAKGKIIVSVRVLDKLLEIRVADSGIGIPPEKHALIFQSFRQVDGDIKRKFGGTGLGLTITRQIVELQGGTIRVESELGKGSTFIVELPYHDTGTLIASQNKPELAFRALNTDNKHLLVVEDNHMNRKYVGALLRKWGMAYTFAHNGREGLEMARRVPFDLILMDVQMPEMDGYEATIAIRQSANPNKKTPIIALTASAVVSQKDKVLRAGMNDYLSKPFKPGQLFEKIGLFCGNLEVDELKQPAMMDPTAFEFHHRLDAHTLREVYGGDLDYAAEMFATFLTHILPDFQQLRPLLETDQFLDFARLAHKLKPTFTIVGLPDLTEHLEQLEVGGKAEKPQLPQLQLGLQQLESALQEAVLAIESDLQKIKIYTV